LGGVLDAGFWRGRYGPVLPTGHTHVDTGQEQRQHVSKLLQELGDFGAIESGFFNRQVAIDLQCSQQRSVCIDGIEQGNTQNARAQVSSGCLMVASWALSSQTARPGVACSCVAAGTALAVSAESAFPRLTNSAARRTRSFMKVVILQ
jgi:hypothetical protein